MLVVCFLIFAVLGFAVTCFHYQRRILCLLQAQARAQERAEVELKISLENARSQYQQQQKRWHQAGEEIRGPLGTLLSFSEILDDPNCSLVERHQCTSIVKKNARTLLNLVDQEFLMQARSEIVDVEPPSRDLFLSTPSSEKSNPLLAGLRLLLVEDREDNRALLRWMLGTEGAALDFAVDGREAFEKATQFQYDLILMDLQMPIMDGYTCVERLRQAGLNIPILALTAHAMNEDRDRCLASGFHGHIAKPIQKEALLLRLLPFLEIRESKSLTAGNFLSGVQASC